jgi:hypothetical protein
MNLGLHPYLCNSWYAPHFILLLLSFIYHQLLYGVRITKPPRQILR